LQSCFLPALTLTGPEAADGTVPEYRGVRPGPAGIPACGIPLECVVPIPNLAGPILHEYSSAPAGVDKNRPV